MAEIRISTSRDREIIDVTRLVEQALPVGLECGICHIFCPHTTAGLTVNENADPDVRHDLLAKWERMAPRDESFYRHGEGNSAAHFLATLTGFSLTLPVRAGRLVLGTWQAVYFCEFDGPRSRKLRVMWQPAAE